MRREKEKQAMSFGGFGKDSGPTIPPRAQTPFGHFPHPPPPSPHASSFPDSSAPPLSGTPGSFGAYERARSPLPFDNAQLSTGSRTSSMNSRSPPYGPLDAGTSISSKVSHSQDVERTRTPVQYNEDFLADPANVGMEVSLLSPPNISVKKFVSHSVSKRNRSPPAGAGQISQISFFSTEDDTERELQAKAKRLARFKTELDEANPGDSLQYGLDVAKKEISSMKADQSPIEKQKFSRDLSGSMEEISPENDNEDLQACSVIVGLCPDMCPESERAERGRKGDLDPYERLDGDRNQTSKSLAVKKYNRTAEREAELIRPMSILRKTMDYLLALLDQSYDDRFLGLYNFLWDRMRAFRMDLRMQHIFNLEAITMLEQMDDHEQIWQS